MARTTSTAVQTLLGGNYDADNQPSLSPFIDAANLIVTRCDTLASANGYTLSTAEKEMIERYLSAHLYTVQDALYSSRSTLGASGSFIRDKDGDYLKAAKMIDPSGALATVLDNNTAGGAWLGKTVSETLSFDERNT